MTETAPTSLVSPITIASMISVAASTPPGCLVEVGVYKGGTAWHLDRLAMSQGRMCYLYDTFAGIPYATPGVDIHQVGDFKDTDFEAVVRMMKVSIVVRGIFPASAVYMPRVAFAHLDCDQYQSIIDACRYLAPKMVKGGVIWFDDSPILTGAEKAVKELYGDNVQILNGKHYVTF